jgi:hypothetical protein
MPATVAASPATRLRFLAEATDTGRVKRRVLLSLLLASLCASAFSLPAGATPQDYQPDAWIHICGQSTGCTVGPPPPHPWLGNNIYNHTAARQTVRAKIDDGEGIRFWLIFQNDGAKPDTYTVHGCKGTPNFLINAVIVGEWKKPVWKPKHITKEFKNGTATFTVAPGKHVAITLNIVTVTPNLTYRCPVTIQSSGAPTMKDTVAAVMTTF